MDLEVKINNLILAALGPGAGHHDASGHLARQIGGLVRSHIYDVIQYWTAETTYLQQRVEELEIDLMLQENGFRFEAAEIKPKRRTNFK